MADTAPTAAAEDNAGSREIRVFLSSTFRDFNEERKLLATRVFPELNRRARERGVELVEVDLRWGVTQEQAEDGHALEICLQEIERCRPYFIGMLGDSYGSLTPPEQQLLEATPQLLEKRQWLEGQIGQASYTELEIVHGLQLLRDPAMEGRAFFYFRDPAWSNPKADAGEPGWRSDDPADRQKLELLRERIRSSGYPLVEKGLTSPHAIADRIKEDLWALIDRQFPEGEQPDALEKEARKHADYRRSRTGAGQYIGGEGYIEQLERWLADGQQQILITGESGAGKSALLANWIEHHSQSHPADVLYAHHLGCTNDANALRPMLGRLIDTASQQLLNAGVITEALAVPEDWWELVGAVKGSLNSLGEWVTMQGRRWIWVLDGLDRLATEKQTALSWLPLNLPDGVQVVVSALACPAREMLIERGYTTLTIHPLATAEQEQLIQRYLKRYTKELDGGLRKQILRHTLAGSPLFLKVLLEELRKCGRHDTLKDQLDFYLSSQTVDDLYERVLERIEIDCSCEALKKVMTALWASRAGLSESELLAITGLAPMYWAPIDLALETALGRNGNRLIFDHQYLKKAVEDRYLSQHESQISCHLEMIELVRAAQKKRSSDKYNGLPDDYDFENDPDNHFAEWIDDSVFGSHYADEAQIFWHLSQAEEWNALLGAFADGNTLYSVLGLLGFRETARIWHIIPGSTLEELGNLVHSGIETALGWCNSPSNGPIRAAEICELLADFLDYMGLDSHRLRSIILDCLSKPGIQDYDKGMLFNALCKLGEYHRGKNQWREALELSIKAHEIYLLNSFYASKYSLLLLSCELALATCKLMPEIGIKILGEVVTALSLDDCAIHGADIHLCYELLAQSHELIGNHGHAIELFDKADELAQQMHGEHSTQVRHIRAETAAFYQRIGQLDNALLISKRLLDGITELQQENGFRAIGTILQFAGIAINAGRREEARPVLNRLFSSRVKGSNDFIINTRNGAALALSSYLSNIALVAQSIDNAAKSNRFLFGGLSHYSWNSSNQIEEVSIGGIKKYNYMGDPFEEEESRRRYLRWKVGVWTRLLGVAHQETVSSRLELARYYCYLEKRDALCQELVKVLLQESDRRRIDSLSVLSAAKAWCDEKASILANNPKVSANLEVFSCYLMEAMPRIARSDIVSPYEAHMKLLSLQHRRQEYEYLDKYKLDSGTEMQWVGDLIAFLIAPIAASEDSRGVRLAFNQGSVIGGAELDQLIDCYLMWIRVCSNTLSDEAFKANTEIGERILLHELERLLGEDHLVCLEAQLKLAVSYAEIQRFDIATTYWSGFLKRCESVRQFAGGKVCDLVRELGRLYMMHSHNDQAEQILGFWHAGFDVKCSNRMQAIDVLNDSDKLMQLTKICSEAHLRIEPVQHLLGESDETFSIVRSDCIQALGWHFLLTGNYGDGFNVLHEFFHLRWDLLSPSNHNDLKTLDRVLEACSALGRQAEGLALSREAQQKLATEKGEKHPLVLTQISNQASLYEELGELEEAKALYRCCLTEREEALGTNHADTLRTAYNLADVLSQQGRPAEAIPLRRRELAWCRQQNGDTDPGTLTSINGLAIDLRETREFEEAEALFRELLEARQQVLEPSDFGIGRALGGLAKTLEKAGNLEEAATFAQQALAHRHEHEGADAWWTNRERLDLARVLFKLGRSTEAISLLDQLHESTEKLEEPDGDDQQLLIEAKELRRSIAPD